MPDLTIERLQKIACSHVSPEYKAKWLKFWNSPDIVRRSVLFPDDRPMKEKSFDVWIVKAAFWAQVRSLINLL